MPPSSASTVQLRRARYEMTNFIMFVLLGDVDDVSKGRDNVDVDASEFGTENTRLQ